MKAFVAKMPCDHFARLHFQEFYYVNVTSMPPTSLHAIANCRHDQIFTCRTYSQKSASLEMQACHNKHYELLISLVPNLMNGSSGETGQCSNQMLQPSSGQLKSVQKQFILSSHVRTTSTTLESLMVRWPHGASSRTSQQNHCTREA